MEYRSLTDLGLAVFCLVHVILTLSPCCVLAQTEGDTGYEYVEAYDDYDEDSVLGVEPNFDVPIVNVTVVAGQTAVLPCSIDSLGKYKVAWLDQKNMPLTFDDRRYVDDTRFNVVRPYIREWNLQIQNVRWEDQGQYRCTINTEPGKSKSIVLHVKVPAQIIDELSTNDVTVQEGDTVVLVCNVTGVPRPEVTWYRRAASSKTHERERIGHVGEVIIIQNVSRYCDDIYECAADNGVPPAVSRQMRVTVEFAPEITMPNARIGQDLGRDTILECIITAYPHGMSYWEKDGREVVSRPQKYRIQPYEDGEHTITLSLSINNLQEEDYGKYSCFASNQLGDDRESMWLFKNQRPTPIPEKPKIPTSRGTYTPTPPSDLNPAYSIEMGTKKKPDPFNDYNSIKSQHRSGGATCIHRSTLLSLLVPFALIASVTIPSVLRGSWTL